MSLTMKDLHDYMAATGQFDLWAALDAQGCQHIDGGPTPTVECDMMDATWSGWVRFPDGKLYLVAARPANEDEERDDARARAAYDDEMLLLEGQPIF
jgi:hypothetical protein